MRDLNTKKFKLPFGLSPKKLIPVIVILLISIAGWTYWKSRPAANSSQTNTQTESTASTVLASTDLGKQFSFTAFNSQGQAAKPVNFTIAKAELAEEVLVQGKPATAKGDKAFLVLHIEIANSETQRLYLAPVDLLRLVDETDKKYAADIHSEVVEIQPISVKKTRVGFVVLKNQNTFNIQVGELEGEKQNLEIKF